MKTGGSYASLLRGVSQQPPEVRQPGQHTEQVNMLSDPVSGLTRRPGSRWLASKDLGAVTDPAAVLKLAQASGYRTIPLVQDGKEYTVLMRARGSGNTLANSLPPCICYNRTDNVFLNVNWVGGLSVDQGAHMNGAGISAATPLGRYIVFAMNGLPCAMPFIAPYPGTRQLGTVVWVRGGAYDRTYSVGFTGGTILANYTTPSPGVAGAATAISPQNIAGQLAAVIAGLGYGVLVRGSHIYIGGNPLVEVSDGGDGSLIQAVDFNGVADTSKLTLMGYQGMVMRIGRTDGNPGFYVRADVAGGASFGEAVWRECAGDARTGNLITNVGIATVHAGQFYIGLYDGASPGAGLNAVTLTSNPEFVGSASGDEESNPTPRWMRGQITYLGTFQDRLLVGCGAALSVSAAGDYFNFFRSTVTTVPLKDPFEMVPQGGEDDILRHSVAYNKNLVIFGDKQQYIIGSGALTPTSPNMNIMTVYPGAATVPPLAAGGQIYYARNRDSAVAIHQIQPGTYVDSAESFPASAQISTYIPANVAEIEGVPGAPAQLLVRSTTRPRDVFTFSYLDQPDGRKQDAWSRWSYGEQCGNLLSVQSVPEGVLLIWARKANGKMWLVADLQSLSSELQTKPYFDSHRTRATVTAGLTDVITNQAGWSVAFDNTTDRFLIGGDLDEAAALAAEYPAEASSLYVGANYESSVTLTNPYARDGQGKAILTGRTVVAKLVLALRRTAGLVATIVSGNATNEYSFNGRVLGNLLNQIGKVPVADSEHTVAIGRETREYTAKLAAKLWYPLNIKGIEWVGQSFNRTPRANS